MCIRTIPLTQMVAFAQSHAVTHTRNPPAKPSSQNPLVLTLHVYPDGPIQLIQQLPDFDLKLTLTERTPLQGHAHFSARVEARSVSEKTTCAPGGLPPPRAGVFGGLAHCVSAGL